MDVIFTSYSLCHFFFFFFYSSSHCPSVLFRCRQRIVSHGLDCGHWGKFCIVSPSTGCFCFGLFGLNNGKLSELETFTRDGKMVVCDHKGITGCLLWQFYELNTDVFGTYCNGYLAWCTIAYSKKVPFCIHVVVFSCFCLFSLLSQCSKV